MIEQLLAWDPLTRLGCLTDGAEGVKRLLAFFKSIDWQKLCTLRREALSSTRAPALSLSLSRVCALLSLSPSTDNHQIPAPYMPELRGDDDLTNFEESNPNDRFLEEPPYEYIRTRGMPTSRGTSHTQALSGSCWRTRGMCRLLIVECAFCIWSGGEMRSARAARYRTLNVCDTMCV